MYRFRINDNVADVETISIGESPRKDGNNFQIPCGNGDEVDKLTEIVQGILNDAYDIGESLRPEHARRMAVDTAMKKISDESYVITTQTYQEVLGQEVLDDLVQRAHKKKMNAALDKAIQEYHEREKNEESKEDSPSDGHTGSPSKLGGSQSEET